MGGRGASSGIVHRVPNYKNATIADAKITKYCLEPTQKHYKDFADVGYSQNEPERLKQDLLNGLAENEAESTLPNEYGDRSFTVYMKLGVNKKKLFRTGWQIDKGTACPRFITAFRVKNKE